MIKRWIRNSKATNKVNLHIIHADPLFLIVNKPGGLLSVPGRGPDKQDCVVNRVKQKYPKCIEQPAVHRLDMDTSGLMVLAFTTEAHRHLSKQFEARLVHKKYTALLDGIINRNSGEISLPFRLDPNNRPYQVYDPVHGKLGVSQWRKIGIEGEKTRVEFVPLTGRTHQLRVHAAHELGLGCPIIGDRLYGNGREGSQMLLHASSISFTHPGNGERLVFRVAAPF